MKLLTVIFSFYILFISCMPCTDVADFKQTGNLKITQPTCSNPHEDETCSPFCVCFCCGSVAVNTTISTEIKIVEFNQEKTFKNNPIKIKNISFSIWQPPKIG